ncbi:MAG: hypothetical protein Q9M76_06700 [Candidatus Dojkabacteria bacterium]|nr:hypothetical protein [Candidatus Dojkabacteria bacterium]
MGSYSTTIKGNVFSLVNVGVEANSYIKNDTSTFHTPLVTIGGTGVLADSLCGDLYGLGNVEQNCFIDSTYIGEFRNMLPENESTYLTSDNYFEVNGDINTVLSTELKAVKYIWSTRLELVTGTKRRTDLADGVITFDEFFGDYFIYNDDVGVPDPGVEFRTLQNITTDCTVSLDDCNGVDGILNKSSFLYNTNGLLWLNGQLISKDVLQDRTILDRSDLAFDGNHIASKNFSLDGNSLTDPATDDFGAIWTFDDTATGGIATADYGHIQTLQIQVVDANPIWNGSEWVITVDSTSDEDNVSISGYEQDPGVAYSGGGQEVVDGLSYGKTSLREAIIVANNFANPVTIKFDIPTTDPGYINPDGSRTSTAEPAGTYTATTSGYWYT